MRSSSLKAIRNKLPLLLIMCVCTSALAEGEAAAPKVPQEPVVFLMYVQEIAKQCPDIIQGIVARGDIASVLENRPTDVSVVCSCTKTAIQNDQRLATQLSGDVQAAAKRLQSSKLKSYAVARTMKAAFSCLAEDLEKSLATAAIED